MTSPTDNPSTDAECVCPGITERELPGVWHLGACPLFSHNLGVPEPTPPAMDGPLTPLETRYLDANPHERMQRERREQPAFVHAPELAGKRISASDLFKRIRDNTVFHEPVRPPRISVGTAVHPVSNDCATERGRIHPRTGREVLPRHRVEAKALCDRWWNGEDGVEVMAQALADAEGRR